MFTRFEGKAWEEKFLPRLSYKEVEELNKEDALIILPIGAVEQHGSHLPLMTDSLISEASITKTMEHVAPDSNIWLIPPLSYGKSNEHVDFPGTISLSSTHLQGIILDIARSLSRSGFRRLVLYNSHGGNVDLLNMVAREIHIETDMMVFITSSGSSNIGDIFTEEELEWGIHGGDVETSMVMAVKPSWVHEELRTSEFPPIKDHAYLSLKNKVRVAWKINDLSKGGTAGDATKATAEKGEIVLLRSAEEMAEALEEMATFEISHLLEK
ncbi:creatininase [Salipaludibacillus keqinensis]|uniref:Creatininase n=1 Tax=Salipaludibacillus keqinensis TaxID=2045207 RepID=A0A323TKW4_9BACI|nr:creatininase family protein [Salipaludibacillus keqinensis]PYZ94756.1 creatininase [Salipaludibacillus keqinensis]